MHTNLCADGPKEVERERVWRAPLSSQVLYSRGHSKRQGREPGGRKGEGKARAAGEKGPLSPTGKHLNSHFEILGFAFERREREQREKGYMYMYIYTHAHTSLCAP